MLDSVSRGLETKAGFRLGRIISRISELVGPAATMRHYRRLCAETWVAMGVWFPISAATEMSLLLPRAATAWRATTVPCGIHESSFLPTVRFWTCKSLNRPGRAKLDRRLFNQNYYSAPNFVPNYSRESAPKPGPGFCPADESHQSQWRRRRRTHGRRGRSKENGPLENRHAQCHKRSGEIDPTLHSSSCWMPRMPTQSVTHLKPIQLRWIETRQIFAFANSAQAPNSLGVFLNASSPQHRWASLKLCPKQQFDYRQAGEINVLHKFLKSRIRQNCLSCTEPSSSFGVSILRTCDSFCLQPLSYPRLQSAVRRTR